MREKLAMKNVASKTDRALFTVWVKVGFPVGMITQGLPPCSKLEETVTRKPESQAKEHQPEALAREGEPERSEGFCRTVSTVLRVIMTLVNRA